MTTRSALRLVSTKQLTRAEWLSVRRQGIGSSDAAAAVGLNPYCSSLQLWLDKTGRACPDEASSDAAYWGTVLEPIVAEEYARRTGNKVRRLNAVLQHPEHRFMLANLDREIVGHADGPGILECKTSGYFAAKAWEEGVPEWYHLQVLHQLAVTGRAWADVAVLIAGQTFQIHRIECDEELIRQLIRLERRFWGHVESDTPPPTDGSESSRRALSKLYPSDTGLVVDYREEIDMNAMFSQLIDARVLAKEVGYQEEQLRQKIQAAMGEATTALFDGGSVSWKKARASVVLDAKRLRAEQPEIAQGYQVTRQGVRRFSVTVDPSASSSVQSAEEDEE